MSTRWESAGAAVYYYLGTSYYVYKWLIIAGISGDLLGPILLGKGLPLVGLMGISSALVVAGTAAWLIKTRKRLHFVNPDLAVVELVDEYAQTSATTYVFEKRLKLKALRSGVDRYRSKFKWSGGGTVTISTTPPLSYNVVPAADMDVLRVDLPTLKKGEVFPLAIRCDLDDPHGSARPFSQKVIDDYYPNGVTMKVRLPTAAQWSREIFLSARSELAIWKGRTRGGKTDFSWRIRLPAIGRRYRVSWTP